MYTYIYTQIYIYIYSINIYLKVYIYVYMHLHVFVFNSQTHIYINMIGMVDKTCKSWVMLRYTYTFLHIFIFWAERLSPFFSSVCWFVCIHIFANFCRSCCASRRALATVCGDQKCWWYLDETSSSWRSHDALNSWYGGRPSPRCR